MMTPTDASRLEIDPTSIGGAHGLAIGGELDVATTTQFTEAVEVEVWGCTGAFVLDLSRLEFTDSNGLTALLRARALLAREDRALALLLPRGPVRRALDLAGLLDTFTVYTTPEALAAALVPADD
jgi:anti-sigma B factor antagonist